VFYSDDAIAVFKESLNNLQTPIKKQIISGIREIESEEVCEIGYELDRLINDLRQLHKVKWQEVDVADEPEDADHQVIDYYKIVPALENFNGLQIDIQLSKKAYKNTIFARLPVNLVDIICDELRKKMSTYCKKSTITKEKTS